MKLTYLLVGGDRRQTLLAGLLEDRGRVRTLGVPGLADRETPEPPDVLVLPCPALAPGGGIRCGAGSLEPEILDPWLRAGTLICGGGLGDLEEAFRRRGFPVSDLLKDPWVAAANARLTAEAAVALAMETLEDSLFGVDCAVVGYGRIGKVLAQRLAAWGARVTVAARRPEVLAEAAQRGCRVCRPEVLEGRFRVVFNTVPAPAVPRTLLEALGVDCLYVELASAPGGLEPGAALPFRVLVGNSLPGRRLPLGAARVLEAGLDRAVARWKGEGMNRFSEVDA